MIRKVLVILLILTLVISQTACSNGAKEVGEHTGVVIPNPKDGVPTLTIMLNPAEHEALTANKFFRYYVDKFKKDFGVEVNYEKLGSSPGRLIEWEDRDEYIKELSIKLNAQNGSELIFSQFMPLEPIIRQGAAVKLNDKIPNLNKVYKGLLDDEIYFVPVSINYNSKIINIEALKSIQMEEPEINWTSQDRFEIRTKWLKVNKMHFNAYEWFITLESILDIDKAYDRENNRISLNTPKIIKDIEYARKYILGGNYILNKNYKLENYFRMITDDNSEEFQESMYLMKKNKELGHIESGVLENILRAIDVYNANYIYGTVLMPEFSDKEVMLKASGFTVNKNAKNPELAYEFINGLLSNEIQMRLYNDNEDGYYPVNKDIEDNIKAIEEEKVADKRVLQTKKHVLNQMKDSQMKLWNTENLDLLNLKQMIEEDLVKIILADTKYSDVELSAKLSELEHKYNIYLNKQ
ncbi:MAG: Bacterial extracellular solute-binding protein [Clostridia bacterium]|jgi:ABC-type glycerol-3-phosphate transport system substrate-binding protein|nr:Bacterial extracellular solute-binding protein [Clostridia bacterium]